MTHVPQSAFTEEAGVLYVQRVCNEANQVFREVLRRDVGIDGFLEVCEDGAPAGKLIGFQIKSGDSFLSADGSAATFKADKPHFGYWATCHFPVIGVVYLPKLGRAVWLDLIEIATDERIVQGPYSESVSIAPGTLLTKDTLISQVVTRAFAVAEGINQPSRRRPRPLSVAEARHLVEKGLPTAHADLPRREAWSQMIDVLLSLTSPDDLVAHMGYRLNWYAPGGDDPREVELRSRVQAATDAQLVKLVRAANSAMAANADPIAEHIVDLVRLIPTPKTRIRRLLSEGLMPRDMEWVAEQFIEALADADE